METNLENTGLQGLGAIAAEWVTATLKPQVQIFMVRDSSATLGERQVMAEILREELTKAKEDASHTIVVPFMVDIVLVAI